MPASQRPARLLSRSVGYSDLRVLAGRRVRDVVGVLFPVVVVAEELGAQAGALELRPERLDQLRLLADRHVHARVGVRLAVLRLVLERERVDRDARALVGAHELDEVARVRVVDARRVDQPAADERLVRLHPRRRAPRRAHHLELRVERERAAQQRQDLLAVVRDREVPQAVVRLAGRHVVVGVVRTLDEVGGAHRLAQERELVVGEQAAHRGLALRLAQAVEDARARVGDRGAEAVHRLVAPARVDADRQRARAAGVEVDRPAVVHLLGAVRRRHPHPRGRRRRR